MLHRREKIEIDRFSLRLITLIKPPKTLVYRKKNGSNLKCLALWIGLVVSQFGKRKTKKM